MLTHIGVLITCIAIVKMMALFGMRRLLLLITVLPDVCVGGDGARELTSSLLTTPAVWQS